jgi:ABC-type bacteriocin/lantibiotic exporter with double-glycine peptidase domain
LATQRLQTRVGVAVQGGLWDRLLRLPPQFFRAYTVGELANRSLGIETMRQLLAPATVDVFITAGFSVASFALLLAYAPGLAAVAGGVIVLMLGVMAWGSHKQLRAQRSAWASEMRVAGFVAQLLTAVGKLRVAGAEDRAFGRWAQEFAKQRRSAQRAMRAINAVATFTVAAPLVCELAVFAASSSSAGKGLTVATFVGFNAALLQVLIALVALGPAVAAVVAAVPLVETTQPILQAVPEITSDGDDPGELSGEIELCNVSFRYGPYGPLAVDDVSFRIRAGELVAIVGPSGSGKSTLIRLLLGFEEPQSGSVLFDGQDLDELDIERVRQQLGVVLQDGALLPTDVLTNLVGVSGASLEDAWRALRMVGLAEQIEQLPMGIHTMISEQSSTFSGGERQRLMLARALVRRPRIMLLDEATSAVDAKAEAQIAASLSSVPATRVVVAHRLTTIAGADRIYVMLGGRLVARGNYDELLESSSTFAELVNRQRL